MAMVSQTDEFVKWFRGLRDVRAKAKVLTRIERLENGNPGDVAPIGENCSEMKIDFGPGYRVYYKQTGDAITILLGGDKATQQRDIEKARALAKTLES